VDGQHGRVRPRINGHDSVLIGTFTGPFFVAFPNLREALLNNTPIKTKARSCTILPNFVGYVCGSVLRVDGLVECPAGFGLWCTMGKITYR